AHEHVAGKKPGENVFDQSDTVKLKEIGCSNSDDTVTVGEARNPPPNLNWLAEFGSGLLLSPLPQTLIVTLVVYVVVRAIGWVIGGFLGCLGDYNGSVGNNDFSSHRFARSLWHRPRTSSLAALR